VRDWRFAAEQAGFDLVDTRIADFDERKPLIDESDILAAANAERLINKTPQIGKSSARHSELEP